MTGFVLILLAIVFLGLGFFSRRKPTWGWSMNEAWKVKDDSEPSYAYIESIKFSGFISIIVGCVFLVFGMLVIFL
ncbi:UNVERIFIED_CONTAM: putative membrane protein [Paenibacillus sp. PvR008]